MFNKLASQLATYCVEHELIEQRLFALCRYKIELFLSGFFFFLLLFPVSAIFHAYIEVFSFATAAYFFRRRMGGWHAPWPWLCQIMSVGLVILAVVVLGPLLEQLPRDSAYELSIALNVFAFILRPAYPPQLHFTAEEALANTQRKNYLLIILTAVQFIAYMWFDFRIVIYTFLGLAVTVFTVLLEKICYMKKGLDNNERLEDDC